MTCRLCFILSARIFLSCTLKSDESRPNLFGKPIEEPSAAQQCAALAIYTQVLCAKILRRGTLDTDELWPKKFG